MEIENGFGIILRQYRTKRELSQEDLANNCDLDRTYISMLELGKRNPTVKTVFVLAKELGISPSKLIREVEQIIATKK
ncbi:helix-turn-helix domain-containing protein [Paenibacillus sp. GCM10023248]|uniref:helix-turn-helix domain-containing protein n=1 Tax=unclassified Paenibacillus TaxID=185978 RepID=UPI002377EB74|nr:helix-turn-helix transcriptional regulator [Paenibacillus sp. MAHUQ-63]MDD9267847.1 helix-turn-helix transcriptional regulator [Paenibacillus sp. MAHUQ-63]